MKVINTKITQELIDGIQRHDLYITSTDIMKFVPELKENKYANEIIESVYNAENKLGINIGISFYQKKEGLFNKPFGTIIILNKDKWSKAQYPRLKVTKNVKLSKEARNCLNMLIDEVKQTRFPKCPNVVKVQVVIDIPDNDVTGYYFVKTNTVYLQLDLTNYDKIISKNSKSRLKAKAIICETLTHEFCHSNHIQKKFYHYFKNKPPKVWGDIEEVITVIETLIRGGAKDIIDGATPGYYYMYFYKKDIAKKALEDWATVVGHSHKRNYLPIFDEKLILKIMKQQLLKGTNIWKMKMKFLSNQYLDEIPVEKRRKIIEKIIARHK